MEIITEAYQFLFISSIIFIMYIVGDLLVKMYGRFKLQSETRFIISNSEKILFWISLGIFFTYIIA